MVCCCVLVPSFAPHRVGSPRANVTRDFQSAQTELYAVKQFVSDAFQQADGSRCAISALGGSLQLIVHATVLKEESSELPQS